MSDTRYGWHFLQQDWTSQHGDEPAWEVGETRTMRGKLVLCERGFHAAKTIGEAVLQYGYGPVLCYVRVDGVQDEDETKVVGRSRTLIKGVNVERELRIIAADCAEHVLPLFEAKHPGDMRVRDCIAAARSFAAGEITGDDLASASDAASGAARAAASYAACDAASAAATTAAASSAASSAAATAASNAVMAAWSASRRYRVRDAARNAERKWQREHIESVLLPLFADVMEATS